MVPRIYHACLSSVCTSWKRAVSHPSFYRERRRLGFADPWLVVLSAEARSAPALLYTAYDLSTRQLLFKMKFPPSVPPPQHQKTYVPPDCPGVVGVERGKENGNRRDEDLCASNYCDRYRIVAGNESFAVLCFRRSDRNMSSPSILTIFNTVADERREVAPLRWSPKYFACGVIGNCLYVAGIGGSVQGQEERMTKVYHFALDMWAEVAALPSCVSKIEADTVFQGRLYVQCTNDTGGESMWVYDPSRNCWEEGQKKEVREGGGRMGVRQLLATDKFLYAIGAHGDMLRYEPCFGRWKPLPQEMPQLKRAALPVPHLKSAGRSAAIAQVAYVGSQRAFGHGNDIFFLVESSRGTAERCMQQDGVTRCHRLLWLPSGWYQAGAVVRA
ncbi:hypothetical protein KP509_08G054200 [Ceratopteris richardii]|uniref:F-box/kelch-repeat protein n=1 Tax=Ceratopteris richardii TaxID=49495 RepID=A0A8T2UDA0_CERRI|nr:hypothetical protein KP509_08G054200 [Ceratopteris richardii]